MTITAKKEMYFEAAHRLRYHKGACKNLHGHSYKIAVHVENDSTRRASEETGMVVDFKILSTVMKEVIDEGLHFGGGAPFDHSVIMNCNDALCETFKQMKIRVCKMANEPTAENMASMFASVIQKGLNSYDRNNVKVVQVDVWETEKSCATWRGNAL